MSANTQTNKSFNLKFVWIGLIGLVIIGVGGWAVFSFTAAPPAQPEAAVETEASNLAPAPVAGHPAPNFTLQTLEGQEVTLSDFEGQPVILNFWATWCGPCRVEMPHLQESFETHQDQGLVVLGVNLTKRDNPSDIPEFVNEFGLTFPIVLDENGEVAKTYNVIGQPASIFIDENGVVHETFFGPVNAEYISNRVDELLKS